MTLMTSIRIAAMACIRSSTMICSLIAVVIVCIRPTLAQDQAHGQRETNRSTKSIHEPGDAVRAPRVTERWSDKGMTQNPVGIAFDSSGNLYIAEGWRKSRGAVAIVTGPMGRSNSLRFDLQNTSVQDRAAHIEWLIENGHYKREFFTQWSDKVRLLKDTDGDGKADQSLLFADGFNDELDGIASDVLWLDGKVYLTNIPNVWMLEDKDGDGDADSTTQGERVSLSYGYGIRWAYGGHDLHGLVLGHDGRIYFSMGDRGYNVTTKEGNNLVGTNIGAVFRMWPDGSGLEMFCDGLRNPQDLAFDNYGNLFTGDNNCDAGDLARFCYLPEGSDTGWRQDVQSLDHRGPWLRERMWEPRLGKDNLIQPSWIMPPLANVGRGPSGLAHYPGTGDTFAPNGSFLMCDYPPGVRHVQVQADGASFVVTQDNSFIDGQTISDLAWGYDGRLYLADWGGGWAVNPNGYIKTMTNQAAHQAQAKIIEQVRSLFANGFDKLNAAELIDLLGHRDQRVRLAAQYELASRPGTNDALARVLEDTSRPELARLHAVWALGMQARQQPKVTWRIEAALDDPSENVRAQAISTLGDLRYRADQKYLKHLKQDTPIVQHHAALALGKTSATGAIEHLILLLRDNNNDDVVLRHAASYALSLIGDADEIIHYAMQHGPAARLGAVLALRRLDSPLLTDFLEDGDPLVAAEAARAIYDRRIIDAIPALASLSDRLASDRMVEPVMRRVIEANIRLADTASAARLARLAANTDAPTKWRRLALGELDRWSASRKREGVWGAWWPREAQPMDDALAALNKHLPEMMNKLEDPLRNDARVLNQRYLANPTPDQLSAMVKSTQEPEALRLAAAQQLAVIDKGLAVVTLVGAAASDQSTVAMKQQLREMLQGLDRSAALQSYIWAAREGEVVERQHAIVVLTDFDAPQANQIIEELARELERGTLAPELRLDVYQAVVGNQGLSVETRAALKQYTDRKQIRGEEPFIRDTVLAGGSIERGQQHFFNHQSAQCQRCHTINGPGSVGPDLGAIGSLYETNDLYTALVNPHADIVSGYATTTITLKNGTTKTGRIVDTKTTPARYVLANADGVEELIPRNQVVGIPITSDQSLMPTMKDKLSASELRDVLAYLGSLKAGGVGTQGFSTVAGVDQKKIVNPAEKIEHHFYLPMILIGIFAGLGLLLITTVLGGGQRDPAA